MNVYEKLQGVRVDLQNINPKKTGNNKFAGYTYYELGDFVPHVNKLMEQYKLTSCLSFGDVGLLEIINTEKPDERIMFTSPMSTAQLKGCHEVQNLGAVLTYIRRYLWTNALELTEHDALDATVGTPEPQKQYKQASTPPKQETAPQGDSKPSEAQMKRLFAITKSSGKTGDEVKAYMKEHFSIDSTKELSKPQYDKVINWLEGK